MALELIYTSAPHGLRPGTVGLATVAATADMPGDVMQKLEDLCVYQTPYDLSDPKAPLNPVNFAHTIVAIRGEPRSVLSRIAFSGADYSRRANFIAHHFLLDATERLPQGPAWMLAQMMDKGILQTAWPHEPAHRPRQSLVGLATSWSGAATLSAATWARVAHEPGWAGLLPQAFCERKEFPAFIVFTPAEGKGRELLALFEESLAILPPPDRWAVNFATYFSTLPPGCMCHWRGVLAGSAAARERGRFPGAAVIDFTQPLPPLQESPFTRAARQSPIKPLEDPRDLTPPPPVDRRPRPRLDRVAVAPEQEHLPPLDLAAQAATPPPYSPGPEAAPSSRRLEALEHDAKLWKWGAIALAAAFLVSFLVNILFLVKWQSASSALAYARELVDKLEKRVAELERPARHETQPPRHETKPPVGPKVEPKVSTHVEVRRPKSETPAPKVVEPKKVQEPTKKPDETQVVTPKKGPEQPKTPEVIDALPEGAKIEERVVARGSGQKLIFEKVAHCDAVVQLPEPLRKALSFDTTDTTATKAGLRVNYTDLSGMPAKLFDAQFSPAENKWVWDLGGDARGKYSAWLEHLVMTAVDTREPQKVAAYRCRCERKEEVRDLVLVLKEDGSSGPKERASATFDYPWPETLMVKHPEHKGGAWSSLEDLTKHAIELERSLPRHARRMVAYKPKAEQVKQRFTRSDSPQIAPRLAILLTVSIGDPDPKTGAKTVRVAITSPELCAYLKSEAEHRKETQKMGAELRGTEQSLGGQINRIDEMKGGTKDEKEARLKERDRLSDGKAYVGDVLLHVTEYELGAIRQRWHQLKEKLQDLGVLSIRDPWELPVAKLTPKVQLGAPEKGKQEPRGEHHENGGDQ